MKWFLDTYLLGARTLINKYPILYYSWLSAMMGLLIGLLAIIIWKF
jgi:hypothetical protein